MTSPVVRWQMVTPHPVQAASFYAEAFGWTISRDNALRYREVSTGPNGLDGGIWPGPPDHPGLFQLFIAVDDVDAAIAKATALGAKVVVPKAVLPDGDAMAILLDPTGMSVGICTLNGG